MYNFAQIKLITLIRRYNIYSPDLTLKSAAALENEGIFCMNCTDKDFTANIITTSRIEA